MDGKYFIWKWNVKFVTTTNKKKIFSYLAKGGGRIIEKCSTKDTKNAGNEKEKRKHQSFNLPTAHTGPKGGAGMGILQFLLGVLAQKLQIKSPPPPP